MPEPEGRASPFATDATRLPVASERLHRDGIQAFCDGDYEEALRLFKQATLIGPSNLEVLKDMGHAHLHLGQTEEARRIYHRAWSEGGQFVDLAYNFGLLCLEQGDAAEASRLLRAVADQEFTVKPGRFYLGLLFPSTSVFMAEVLLFLGLAARERGRSERALKHLRGAVELNPRLMSAHQVLAECYVALRRWHEAADKCRELLTLLPSGEGMDTVHLTLAQSLFEDGKTTEAVRELHRVLDRDPENAGACHLKQCFEDRLGTPISPRPRREVDSAEVATPLFDLRGADGLASDLEQSELTIIGKSQAMYRVLRHARLAAASNSTVLLTGENGTGKELIARAIYLYSPRRHRPMIAVNCAALPETLLESELFGHEKGAFTGAHAQKKGRFEVADGGTLFLDEVGEMSLALQVKLLRALQEQEFTRVGGTETIKVDVRIIAATNQDLDRLVKERRFREDLYYRLNVLPIAVPPVRERREDIPLLVEHFMRRYGGAGRGEHRAISDEEMEILMDHSWPGNVRELENFIERACVMGHSEQQLIEEIHRFGHRDQAARGDKGRKPFEVRPDMSLAELERAYTLHVLERTAGSQKQAAEILGINPSTLWRKLKRYQHRER